MKLTLSAELWSILAPWNTLYAASTVSTSSGSAPPQPPAIGTRSSVLNGPAGVAGMVAGGRLPVAMVCDLLRFLSQTLITWVGAKLLRVGPTSTLATTSNAAPSVTVSIVKNVPLSTGYNNLMLASRAPDMGFPLLS